MCTWKPEFTEDDVRKALDVAGLSLWSFSVWSDGTISCCPPVGTDIRRTHVRQLEHAFEGLEDVLIEPVFVDDFHRHLGLRVTLQFPIRKRDPDVVCAFCSKTYGSCRCQAY